MSRTRSKGLWQNLLGHGKVRPSAAQRRMFFEPLETRQLLTADAGGNSFAAATELGSLNGTRQIADFVGAADVNDYYRLRLNGRGDLRVDLSGLSADADLQLLNSSGGVLARSTRGGAAAELIQQTLDPGIYTVRVYRYSGNTNYRLTLRAATLAAARGGVRRG